MSEVPPWRSFRLPKKSKKFRGGLLIQSVPIVLLVYVALYVVGMLAGLAAKIVFDVQLRRPGTRPIVGLILFIFLFWGAISLTHTPFTDVLLPLVWAGTGLLCGFGSQEPHAAT